MAQRKTDPEILATPPQMRSHIRGVIKLLMGDKDRTYEQPYPLKRIDLALDMREREGHILDAIYQCSAQQYAPTPSNVISLLEINRRMDVESPREYVEKLIEENKEDSTGIRPLSNFVSQWIKERSLESVGQVISAYANDAYMDYSEKYDAAMSVLLKVSPNDAFVYEEITEEEFRMVTMRENERIWQLRESGQALGPQFSFEAVNAYFSFFEWGEVTLITGKKGMGKTTIAQSGLSENISWKQKLRCDTCHISLETPTEVLSRRQFSRYSAIPYHKIKDGIVRLASPEWKPKWDAWMATCKQRANEFGYIRYSYAPGASVHDIIALMVRSSEASLSLGRRIIFIIDHLHSITWETTHASLGEYGARRAIFELLAAAANKLSVRNPNHLFVFAQEGEEKGQTFGGKFQSRRAQYVFSLGRETFGEGEDGEAARAPEHLPITVLASSMSPEQKQSDLASKDPKDSTKYRLLDATGEPRYWYRKGDKYSHKGSMDMVWGNDNPLGKIRLLYESALSRVIQDPDQVTQMRKDGLLEPIGIKR